MRGPLSLLRSSRGQGITEFALILPFLLMLIGAIIDFGLLLLVGQIIENASREGARAGAVVRPAVVGVPTFPTVEEDTCALASDPDCSGTTSAVVLPAAASRVPNVGLFDLFTITSECIEEADPNEDGVRVTVSGTYNWFLLGGMIAFLGHPFPNQVDITRSTTMRWEWQVPGNSCP